MEAMLNNHEDVYMPFWPCFDLKNTPVSSFFIVVFYSKVNFIWKSCNKQGLATLPSLQKVPGPEDMLGPTDPGWQ